MTCVLAQGTNVKIKSLFSSIHYSTGYCQFKKIVSYWRNQLAKTGMPLSLMIETIFYTPVCKLQSFISPAHFSISFFFPLMICVGSLCFRKSVLCQVISMAIFLSIWNFCLEFIVSLLEWVLHSYISHWRKIITLFFLLVLLQSMKMFKYLVIIRIQNENRRICG